MKQIGIMKSALDMLNVDCMLSRYIHNKLFQTIEKQENCLINFNKIEYCDIVHNLFELNVHYKWINAVDFNISHGIHPR